MARCKNCIHFGICKKGFPWADGKGGGWCENFLTADVVPREEVARLQSKINRLEKYDEERDIALHSRLIANARSEAAKEIFEEIDNKIGFQHDVIDILNILDELRKKYTEEE